MYTKRDHSTFPSTVISNIIKLQIHPHYPHVHITQSRTLALRVKVDSPILGTHNTCDRTYIYYATISKYSALNKTRKDCDLNLKSL